VEGWDEGWDNEFESEEERGRKWRKGRRRMVWGMASRMVVMYM